MVLLVLSVLGLPRLPTPLVAGLAAAYLAYFTVASEQAANDPAFNLGIMQHQWVFGFWGCWLGLLLPAILALAKPRPQQN
jgi:hypothetical protein